MRTGSGGPDTEDDGKTYRGYGAGDTVTFRFSTAHSPSGYDVTKIMTFAGHGDGRASQDYAVFVAFASDPSKFALLVPDASVVCAGGSSEVVIHNPRGGVLANGAVRASGVSAIRLDFHDVALGFNVYREVQVFGQTTSK